MEDNEDWHDGATSFHFSLQEIPLVHWIYFFPPPSDARKVDVDGVWSDMWSSSIGFDYRLVSFGALATVGGLWSSREDTVHT